MGDDPSIVAIHRAFRPAPGMWPALRRYRGEVDDETLYDRVGGLPFFAALVDRFLEAAPEQDLATIPAPDRPAPGASTAP